MNYPDFSPEEIFSRYQKAARKGQLKRAYHCLEKLLKICPPAAAIELLEEIIPLTLDMKEFGLTKYWLKYKIDILPTCGDYTLLSRLEAESGKLKPAAEYLKIAKRMFKNVSKKNSNYKWYVENMRIAEYIIKMNSDSLLKYDGDESPETVKAAAVKSLSAAVGGDARQPSAAENKSNNKVKKPSSRPEQSAAKDKPAATNANFCRVPVKLVQVKFDAEKVFSAPVSLKVNQFLIEYEHLKLQEEFDELICLKDLPGIEKYWYQIESAKKVLKRFYGRALLADEVGLGKTIEAGMLIKEYLMRNLAKRVLILVPASLVTQWKEEMKTKFGLDFISSEDEDTDPGQKEFWKKKLVIASLQLARNSKNLPLLSGVFYDMVVVDEAHHLRNRNTASWKLVDRIEKRFILLLTATPVQNNLLELFNLITLLKPGQLKTEKEFRKNFMKRGTSSRGIVNRDKLRELLREVMIRNTRSTIDLKLPKRFASTVKIEPGNDEKALLDEIYALIRSKEMRETVNKPFISTLLMEAGSSYQALRHSLLKAATGKNAGRIKDVTDKIYGMEESAKGRFLADFLMKNPGEKKVVFTHYLKTMDYLFALLDRNGLPYSKFSGSMSAREKDEAVEKFRKETNILLSSESGGEGRNLQFCNTIINYDLPWNPMRIEQRIGRLHRIGQTRDVFIFNMSVKGTIEERILGILDEKINMFELVIGEIEPILGFLGEEKDFDEIVLDLWLKSGNERELADNFEEFGATLVKAKQEYIGSKELDRQLFSGDYEA